MFFFLYELSDKRTYGKCRGDRVQVRWRQRKEKVGRLGEGRGSEEKGRNVMGKDGNMAQKEKMEKEEDEDAEGKG